jgi:uncharacterized protein YybS (DUF2232 family)
MTKYTVASQRRSRREEQTISPIWRGIGCLMFLGIPLVSYFLAVVTVQLAVSLNWPMPYQLMGYPVMPTLLMKSQGLAPVVTFIEAQQNLYAILLITIIFVVALGTLVSLVYSLVYRIVGPPRYGPLDMPPPKGAPRRYKR